MLKHQYHKSAVLLGSAVAASLCQAVCHMTVMHCEQELSTNAVSYWVMCSMAYMATAGAIGNLTGLPFGQSLKLYIILKSLHPVKY